MTSSPSNIPNIVISPPQDFRVEENVFEIPREDSNLVSCQICLTDMTPPEKITIVACRHIFHEDCLATWISRGARNFDKCPSCRTDIDTEILALS